MIAEVRRQIRRRSSAQKSKVLQSFFKTGPGEYGEGDVFCGVTVPDCRDIARAYPALTFLDLKALLASEIHEERLVSLLILVERFKKADEAEREKICSFYLKQIPRINNWDLVDLSADKIAGAYFLNRSKAPLYRLIRSPHLWARRIAVVSSLHWIRAGQFQDTLRLCAALMNDPHDLMHKACGWMLREVGKRDTAVLEGFLKKYCRVMPRTMLRYSIERLPAAKKMKYMRGKV